MSGSIFGRGAFGQGRYSRADSKNAGLALASASSFGVGAERIIAVTLALRSVSTLAVGAHVMWGAIAVPPCQPWTPAEVDPCEPWDAIGTGPSGTMAPCAPWTSVAACHCPPMMTWPA